MVFKAKDAEESDELAKAGQEITADVERESKTREAVGSTEEDWDTMLQEEDDVVSLKSVQKETESSDEDEVIEEAPLHDDSDEGSLEESEETSEDTEGEETLSEEQKRIDEAVRQALEAQTREQEETQQQQPSVEEQQAQRQNQRKQFVDALQKHYAFSDEEAELLQTNPAEVLPKLAANLQANTTDMVLQLVDRIIQERIPSMVDQYSQVSRTAEKNEEQFFTVWPELKEKKHHNMVLKAAQDFRANNPDATAEEFVEEVGKLAWMRAKLPMNKLVAKLTNKEQAQVAKRSSGKPEKPTRSPVGPGAGGPGKTNQSTKQQNEFALLAEEILHDDS